jgi:hypothetical protein
MQRAYGIEIPETLEEVCRPESAPLLVYDMQAGMVGFVPVVVADACGVVGEEAGRRSLAGLDYAAMSLQTDVETITRIWGGSEQS